MTNDPIVLTPKSELSVLKEIILSGGIIAYPTETFYGLGVDPFNKDAVKKLTALKGRPPDKPISILIKDADDLLRVVANVPAAAKKLIKNFWPGPLTIILKARETLPGEVTAGTNTIGVRVSSSPIAACIMDVITTPLTATSANPEGAPPARSARECIDYFGTELSAVIDGGESTALRPSTLVDASEDKISILREGDISSNDVNKIIKEDQNENHS
ncbi:MAG: threonylcarbamoyl-AMP synthase [Deltaproteobacteria bacterium]|nr:threonylcarbamoyl-AMP synthase [Deltaproteobacteria bacterium]